MALSLCDGIALTDHIDTMVLRALIDENDDADLRSGARKLLQKHGGPLTICHLTIGETFATMAEDEDRTVDDCCEAMREFHRMIAKGSVQICGINCKQETHALAGRLHEADRMLESNDGLILSNALLCKECSAFHTMDTKMLYSTAIKTIADDHSTKIVQLQVPETNKNRRRTYR